MSATPQDGDAPTIVRLNRLEGIDLVNDRLHTILENMHCDPVLDAGAATGALVGTIADLILRLRVYLRYPYKLCTMCRKWFPATYAFAIARFLREEANDLDKGFSLVVQRLALGLGGELASSAWLASDTMQVWLGEAAEMLLAHSLHAERAAAEVKRRENRSIVLLANVSRDVLCTRFARQRLEQAQALEQAYTALRKEKRTQPSAIAWRTARPAGVPWTLGNKANRPDAELEVATPRRGDHATGGLPDHSPMPGDGALVLMRRHFFFGGGARRGAHRCQA